MVKTALQNAPVILQIICIIKLFSGWVQNKNQFKIIFQNPKLRKQYRTSYAYDCMYTYAYT